MPLSPERRGRDTRSLLIPTCCFDHVSPILAANVPDWLQRIVVLLGHGQPLFILMCGGDCFLLLLLYRHCLQPGGDRGQLKKYGGLFPAFA
jgi:hypothetical protein